MFINAKKLFQEIRGLVKEIRPILEDYESETQSRYSGLQSALSKQANRIASLELGLKALYDHLGLEAETMTIEAQPERKKVIVSKKPKK